MKCYLTKELKKDRISLEMAMVGFAGVLEDTMENIIKPSSIEERREIIEDLSCAIDAIKDILNDIEYSEERLNKHIAQAKETLTDIDRINLEREESTASLLADEEEVQV